MPEQQPPSPRPPLRNFHPGEARLQRESNIDTVAFDQAVDQPFRPELNPSEVRFVGQRTFSVAASIDGDGRPWASPLLGRPHALFTVHDDTTVVIRPQPVDGDVLLDNVRNQGEMGVLYFDPSRRRRAKSLGRGTVEADDAITYRMHRMFGLCNKYIYKRSHDPAHVEPETTRPPEPVADRLSPDDRRQLERADTIFLASHSDQHGADPTHRGGPGGFITVVDDATLEMPDYTGNGMFQTLGNLLLDDRIGLLAIDFETGRSLQLTGRGSIRASDERDPYSRRTLVLAIDEARTSWLDIGTWTDIEAFELRPGLVNPATPTLDA